MNFIALVDIIFIFLVVLLGMWFLIKNFPESLKVFISSFSLNLNK